ncbi:MAG TPA: SIS domain-containing protein [Armatimonadota bacterium]|jgi:glucosamine--fructose-6-phosphate aminotransferase (isomerizing)
MSDAAAGQRMISEIREQPVALARMLEAEGERVWALAERWRENPPRYLSFAARGTSDHAAIYAKYLFETTTGIPVMLAAPSINSIYQAPLKVDGGLFVGISQSGEAADVIAVLEHARKGGADTLALTNVPDSPLVGAAEFAVGLHANREYAVAATKTFTNTLGALLLLASAIAGSKTLLEYLQRLPALISQVLASEDSIRRCVERFRYLEECVVLGRGYNLSIALELALKLRETSYIRAQPFASPDFLHGPIAVIERGYPVIAIANQGAALKTVLEVMEETQRRGAEVVAIGNAPEALDMATIAIPTNPEEEVPEVISPFPSIVAGQILAQAVAVIKGNDPDSPRGLHKVTVTH